MATTSHSGPLFFFFFIAIITLGCAYRYRYPRWRSWEYGIPDQRPYTISGPFQPSCSWPWSWGFGKCEAAFGKRAPTGRSTRWP